MAEMVTTGVWRVRDGRDTDFVEAWADFADWASAMPGSATLRLGRDVGDPSRYVSFAPWRDSASVRQWKDQPQFGERLARVMQLVDSLEPAELEVVAAAGRSSTRTASAYEGRSR